MNLTIIVALITAISAILAPVISSIITSHNAYKLKTVDLFFNAKLDAYERFVDIAFSIHPHSSAEDLAELQSASAYAFLFCSPSTREKVSIYCSMLMDDSYACNEHQLNKLSNAKAEAIQAMQDELYNFKNYHKHRNNS